MMSEEQIEKKIKKTLECARLFLETQQSNKELANRLVISSSTVQRYLNDKETLTTYLGEEKYNKIQLLIKINKQKALSKGGKISTSLYMPSRDDIGKFTGNIKRSR